jgi:endogenous inhibitor of DNA gyrase (YacG/DUF329 family)
VRRSREETRTTKGAKKPRRLKCPICGKTAAPDYRPFCSKHCADIDLGRWLEGRYAVPGEATVRDSEKDD